AREVLSFAAAHDDPGPQLNVLAVAEARPAQPVGGADPAGSYATSANEADAAPVERQATPKRRGSARTALLVVAAVAIVAAPSACGLRSPPSPPVLRQEKAALAPPATAGAPPAGLKAPPASIAVLPFINLSGDASQDYLADGITDSLISDLVHALPGVPVISR